MDQTIKLSLSFITTLTQVRIDATPSQVRRVISLRPVQRENFNEQKENGNTGKHWRY